MNIEQTFDIYEAKNNVKKALEATSDWRKAAAEDLCKANNGKMLT